MRRSVGLVLIGLGVFLVVAAAMLRFYAYPTLAVVPKDQDSVTSLEATDATIFDVSSLEEITTDLVISSATRGDVDATDKAPDGVVVWVNATTVALPDGTIISQSTDISPMDANTAEAVNCCGAAVDVVDGQGTPIERSGLVFKFPFNTQKQTYDVWDDSTSEAVKAEYVEEDEVEGMTVYKFHTVIPETVTGTREVPASILGLDGDESVDADETYEVDRTYFVEPITGAVVNRIDDQRATLQYEGAELVTTEGSVAYTDAEIKETIDQIDTKAKLLALIHGWGSIAVFVVGLILLALGVLVVRRAPAKVEEA